MKTKPQKDRRSNDNIAIGFTVGWMFGALLDTFIWNDSGIFTIAGTLLGYKQTRIGENHVG